MKLLIIFLFILVSLAVYPQDNYDDKYTYKNQKASSFSWDYDVPAKEFLSVTNWIKDTDLKSELPEWEKTYRARKNREVVGRFFQCVGTCHVEGSVGFYNPSYRSTIYEGDDIQTLGDSYAWIFLLDGTMVRLSPDSSITINEINLSKNENFFVGRINVGNVLWMSRLDKTLIEHNFRETDALFFPLNLYEANPAQEVKPYLEDNLILIAEEKMTTLNHIKKLNTLIEENNRNLVNGKKSFAFLALPNITLMGYEPVIEAVVLLGGKSFFRKRSFIEQEFKLLNDEKESELQYQLRGYENKKLTTLDSFAWMEVDPKGRSVQEIYDSFWLDMSSFITKRIPSIMMAREYLLRRYSSFMFQKEYDQLSLAKKEGYRLWEKSELDERLDFLKEYSRRMETTNLLSSSHFTERMKQRGQPLVSTEYSDFFFRKALKKLYSHGLFYDETDVQNPLNSTTKLLWKMKYGIR